MKKIASFGEAQLNRIFPFYILIDQDLAIASTGRTLEKLYPGIHGSSFIGCFKVVRPEIPDHSLASLHNLLDQVVIIECQNEKRTTLRGQLEWLDDTNQLLFLGSPWFDSIETVTKNNLSLNDFAYHDPMIDLLHVLKTVEITNDDLKHLFKTVSRQKNDLKKATKEIENIALFTTQNPDPLIRIDLDGNLLRQNPVAEGLSEFIYAQQKFDPYSFWKHIAKGLDPKQDRVLLEAEANKEVYSFVIKPLPESGYYNIYGRKVTAEKKKELQLQVLSSIAAQNAHGVVIADSEGKIEWVNKSFEEMTGYTMKEMKGRKPGHLLQGPDTDPEKVKYLSEQIAKGEPFICEILNYKRNQQPYWLRIQGQALRDHNGKITKYFAIEEDITTEIENNRKIREFEDRFRMALEKIGDYVWEHDFSSGHTRFSKKENHFIGIRTEDLENNRKLWLNAVLEEDRHLLQKNDRQYKAGKLDNHALEYRLRHTDGSIKWVLDRGVVIEKDAKGKPSLIIGTHTDITRQKTLELELEATANRLTSLIQNLYAGVLLEQEDQTIGLLNQQFCDLFQIPLKPEQLIGTDCSQAAEQVKHLFKETDHFVHRIEQILLDKKLVIKEHLEMVDGRHLHRDFIPIWNGDIYSGHLWLYTDITEQINADKKLEEQRIFYEQILNNMPADIAVFDHEHRYQFLNPQAINDPQLRSWMIGKRDEDYVAYRKLPSHKVEKRRAIFNKAIETKKLQAFEEVFQKPDGSQKYVLRNLYPVINELNEVAMVVGYGMDITPLKNIQHQVEESEKRYRDVIENSLALILIHDLEGNILSANPTVGKTYGYTNEEIVGRSVYDFLPDPDEVIFREQYLPGIQQKKQESGILKLHNKNGKVVYTLFNNFLKEEPGRTPYVIVFAVDITDRIKAEKELKIAKKATEDLAEAKQNFLANMSHEIRTPMNAIIGMSNQLSKTDLSERQKFFLNTIHTAADNLLVIINDILDLSKIEAGELSIEEIGFEPAKLIDNAIRVLTHKAEEKGIELSNSFYDPRLSPVLIGDPHRLNQILLNLLSNAIKFTDQGKVDVTFDLLEDSGPAQRIRLRVTDTGVGMDEEFLRNLFKKFSQEDPSVSRRFGGTGLGMTITQSLLQLLGGTIDVKSKKNEGTEVTIEMELKKGRQDQLDTKKIVAVDTDSLKGRKILLVDDNEMNRLVASTILQNFQVETLEAENGRQAIEKTQSENPEIILMDLQMPVLNGLEATRLIRESGNEIPIIALTANAIKGENEKCFAVGMNDYIAKPYKEEELLHKLLLWLPEEQKPVKSTRQQVVPNSPENPLYDLSELNEIGRGNQVFLKKMIHLFCTQSPVIVSNMISAYKAGDLQKMGALAHKIKPSIDSLQILSIKQSIRAVEKVGKDGKDAPELKDLLKKIRQTIDEVVLALEKID